MAVGVQRLDRAGVTGRVAVKDFWAEEAAQNAGARRSSFRCTWPRQPFAGPASEHASEAKRGLKVEESRSSEPKSVSEQEYRVFGNQDRSTPRVELLHSQAGW